MTLSKILFIFSKKIGNDDVLNNPQDFLGPNTNKLLQFWSLLDTLTEEQWEILEGRFDDFYNNQGSKWYKAVDEAIEASKETIGEFTNNAANAAWDVYGHYAPYWATREIIGGVKNPVFLPRFDNL